MRQPSRVPAPLPCAIVLAVCIAITGLGRRSDTPPPGAIADDRAEDRIVGTLGGPLIRTPRGVGAPLHADGTTVWIWTDASHVVVADRDAQAGPRRVAIAPGQRIVVSGRLRTPRGYLDPGSPDRAAVTASRGAAWELSATHIEVLGEEPGFMARAWRWAARVQADLGAAIRRGNGNGDGNGNGNDGDDAARAALEGIVTGDRTRIPEALDARWRAVGIYHVLSVSGLHLAVIAGLAFALLRRLVAASPLGARSRPARWAAPAALVLAVGYTLVTGAQLATLRALLVVTIVLCAQMLDRPARLVDALGAAAIAILVWRPQDLYDASFQLSFVAALTLALIPPRPPLDPECSRAQRIGRWVARGLATSAWVTITTAPITALHFQQVAVGGVIGNLALTPLVEMAALPLGLAGAALGSIGLDAAGGVLVEVAVWIVARVDDLAGGVAHAMPIGTIALRSPVLAAAMVAVALWSCTRNGRTRVELVAWAVLCGAWALAPAAPPPGVLRVTFLDVGQGDAAIVELPSGAVWLVDAGGLASSRDIAAASAPGRAIARALAAYGHAAIDRAIVSHPHPDHYLGLAAIGLPIRELWHAVEDSDDERDRHGAGSYQHILDGLAARGTRIVRPALGGLRTGDGVTLTTWAPRFVPAEGEDGALAPDPVRSVNDNSLVVAIEYGGRTILFAGDLEAEGEEALVAAGLPAVDVVKVAHHGSRTSSSPAFVAATTPSLAVISCGPGNAFGFPAAEVLARWRRAGAAIARTDLDGAVTVTIGPTGTLVVDRYAHERP